MRTYIDIINCDEATLVKYLPNVERHMYHGDSWHLNIITTDDCAAAIKQQLDFCVANVDLLYEISFYNENDELGYPDVRITIELGEFENDVVIPKDACNSIMQSGISIIFSRINYDN